MSKKFIFSAVALMAFSFAGMANEIAETEVDDTIVKEADCGSYARASIVAETQQYGVMSQSEFNEAFSFYYNTCVDANNSGATLLNRVFVNP